MKRFLEKPVRPKRRAISSMRLGERLQSGRRKIKQTPNLSMPNCFLQLLHNDNRNKSTKRRKKSENNKSNYDPQQIKINPQKSCNEVEQFLIDFRELFVT